MYGVHEDWQYQRVKSNGA